MQNVFVTRIREVVYDMYPKGGQVEFAVDLGFPQSTVNSWCTGRTKPNSFALVCIADFCNVSIDWLLGLSDKKELRDETKKASKEV